MPAPSKIAIATSVLNRLIKEETSYHKEAESQQKRITKLETDPSDDENAEFTLRQEVS
jgi:tubulin-specific chaperone A